MTRKTPDNLRKRLGDPSKGAEPTKKRREFLKSQDLATTTTAVRPEIPKAKPGAMKRPTDLDDAALEMWDHVTETSDWLIPSDGPALKLLCRMQSRVNDIMEKPDLSPQDASIVKTLFSMYEKFGLTPESRLAMGLTVAEVESKLASFRNEHAA